MSPIIINGISVDTDAPKVALAALALNNETAANSDYVLVQPAQPLNKADRKRLADAGAKILEAVPGALVCHFPGTDLLKIRALPFVTWADVYPNVVKIAPSLLELEPKTGGIEAAAAVLSKPPALDSRRVTVDAVLHRGVDPKAAADKIAKVAHVRAEDLAIMPDKIRLTIKRRRLADVANVDEVRHLEDVAARALSNNVARSVLGIEASPAAPAILFTGKGEVVGVADTGFDKGSKTDVHPAFAGRVKKLYALGRLNKSDDPDGHGTPQGKLTVLVAAHSIAIAEQTFALVVRVS